MGAPFVWFDLTATDGGRVGEFYQGFHLVRRCPHPTEVTTPDLVGWCADRLAPFAPVHHWLTGAG